MPFSFFLDGTFELLEILSEESRTDIHVPQRMNCNNIGDSPTFQRVKPFPLTISLSNVSMLTRES